MREQKDWTFKYKSRYLFFLNHQDFRSLFFRRPRQRPTVRYNPALSAHGLKSQQKIVAFQSCCVYSCDMAINDVAGKGLSCTSIVREFPGHNFVSDLRTLKTKTPKIPLKS